MKNQKEQNTVIQNKLVYISMYGTFSYEQLERKIYKKERDENNKTIYADLDGNRLTQLELITTSFSSF